MTPTDAHGIVHRGSGVPGAGEFTGKGNARPAGELQDTPSVHPPEDPWGAMPAYPVSAATQKAYESAATFSSIDDVYKRLADATNLMGELDARWGAVERGRQLRREGAATGTPTGLPATGFHGNPFTLAENDVELIDLFALVTEELPGDGEASDARVSQWYRNITVKRDERRTELVKAGAVRAGGM